MKIEEMSIFTFSFHGSSLNCKVQQPTFLHLSFEDE
jgi:hypothetical protein